MTFHGRELRGNPAGALVFPAFIPLADLMEMMKGHGLIPTFPLW